jgi:membrane protease YdiL (CAAX protease family)
MTDVPRTRPDTTTGWRDGFRGGVWPLVAVVGVVAVLILLTTVVQTWLLGSDPTASAQHLSEMPSFALLAAIALLALRYDGTSLPAIGLDRSHLAPAVVAAVGFVVAANLVGVGLALRADGSLSFGFIYDHSATLVAAATVNTYLFNAVAEELFARGYVQNKLVVLLDGRNDTLRRGVGVVAASALFAVLHVPTLLQQGAAAGTIPVALLPLFLTGLAFGAVYELTRNLLLVILLHGVGNYWPLFVEGVQWPNWVALVGVYILLVGGYRVWSGRADREPVGVGG